MGCLGSKSESRKKAPLVTKNSSDRSSGNEDGQPRKKPYNIVMVGDINVGKTSLLLRFMSDEWTENSDELREKTTVGTDFYSKVIQKNGRDITLHVWDTGGQERYATMTQSYYRQSDCIIVVYDVTNQNSFETTAKWWKEIDRYSKKDVVRILAGNKSDLKSIIETEKGREHSKSLGATHFFETSAKNGSNCAEIFTDWIK